MTIQNFPSFWARVYKGSTSFMLVSYDSFTAATSDYLNILQNGMSMRKLKKNGRMYRRTYRLQEDALYVKQVDSKKQKLARRATFRDTKVIKSKFKKLRIHSRAFFLHVFPHNWHFQFRGIVYFLLGKSCNWAAFRRIHVTIEDERKRFQIQFCMIGGNRHNMMFELGTSSLQTSSCSILLWFMQLNS